MCKLRRVVNGIFTAEVKHKCLYKQMGNLLYIIAVILIIGWAVGFFAYSAGGIIHVLLVIAVIAIILRLIRGNSII